MKKKISFLLICMIIVSASALIITRNISKAEDEDNTKIVASFYPMYIITNYLIDDVDKMEVVSLTDYETGCLHDYQLTTRDMKVLEDAELTIINGGGMESFIDEILESYPDLPIINASEAIPLLASVGHAHHEDDHLDHHHEDDDHVGHDHDHEYNAHVWLNMDYYIEQIKNVQKGLSEFDPANKNKYEENSKEYQDKIRQLQGKYRSSLANYKDIPIIIFHESFAYLADEFGLNVVHIVNLDSDTYLSANQVKEVINKINQYDVKILFTEAQYSSSIAESIADETDAQVYIVDSIVTGDEDKDAYIKGMEENLEKIVEAYEANWR